MQSTTPAESLDSFASLLRLSQDLLHAADVSAVCHAAAAAAAALAGAEFVALLLLDESGTQLEGHAAIGWDAEVLQQPGLPVGRASQSGYAVMLREPVVCADYVREQRFEVPASVFEEGIRSGVAVPLLAGDQARGTLVVHSRRAEAFSPIAVQWLMLLANQATVALDKVQLYERERRRAEQLRLMNEISRRLNRSLDPDEQIHDVVQALADLFGYSDVSVLLLDAPGRALTLHSAAGPGALDRGTAYQQSIDVGIIGHVARTSRSYLSVDLAHDPYYYGQPGHALMGAELCVPLRHESGPLGVLNIESPEPSGLRAEDLVVAETVADQLATALSNAYLYHEARVRLDHLLALQQTALDILGRRDVNELLQRIVERAVVLLGAKSGTLYMLDAETGALELVVAHDVSPELLGGRLPLGAGLAGRVAQTGEPMIVEHYSTWSGRSPDYEGMPIGAVVGVPMKWQGQVVGELDVWLPPGEGHFSPDDMWLLSLYGDQAAVAIENARLLEGEQQRRARLDALYEIAQTLNATLDTRAILSRVTDEAMRATHATHGLVLFVNEAEGIFERHVLRGFTPELAERAVRMPLPLTRGINGRAYATRQVVYADDVSLDPDYVPLVPETRAELAVPIMRGAAVLANIDLQASRVGAFAAADFDFLRALADQAAIALENARLLEHARRRLAELTVLHEVALVAASASSVERLLEGVTAILARGLYADNVGVLLVRPDGQVQFHASYRGLSAEAQALTFAPGLGVWGMVLQTGQPMLIGDTSGMPGVIHLDPQMRAQLCVPLLAGDAAIGVINTESQRAGAYGEADLRLLTTLAGQIATAIEKLRLIDAERQHAALLEQHVHERTLALRQQTERTEAILRSVAEAVLMLDPDGSIVLHNPVAETLLGDEAFGPQLRDMARRLAAAREPLGREELSSGGLTLEAYASRVTSGGEMLGTVVVLHDVTRLVELNRLKSEFVSNVSHELRTPLTNMKMYLNLLQKGRPERQAAYLDTMRRETWRLERLVEDLLTISRLDLGTRTVALRPAQLNEALAMLVADRQALAGERGLVLLGQWSPAAPAALADEELIVQAVGNLISNAMAYTPRGGCVIVRSEPEEQAGQAWLAVRVSDTGPGIPPGERERVFERFYRGEAAQALNVPGTGMGLAIVKEIVERHTGQVRVASEVGQGATFTILLPVEKLGSGAQGAGDRQEAAGNGQER